MLLTMDTSEGKLHQYLFHLHGYASTQHTLKAPEELFRRSASVTAGVRKAASDVLAQIGNSRCNLFGEQPQALVIPGGII